MRARLVSNRYCPDPLGVVTAEQLDKMEFDEQLRTHQSLPLWGRCHGNAVTDEVNR